MEKKVIAEAIRDSIYENTNVRVMDVNENLLNDNVKIEIVDFLYVFDDIEKKFGIDLGDIIGNMKSYEFTIQTLANAISIL